MAEAEVVVERAKAPVKREVENYMMKERILDNQRRDDRSIKTVENKPSCSCSKKRSETR